MKKLFFLFILIFLPISCDKSDKTNQYSSFSTRLTESQIMYCEALQEKLFHHWDNIRLPARLVFINIHTLHNTHIRPVYIDNFVLVSTEESKDSKYCYYPITDDTDVIEGKICVIIAVFKDTNIAPNKMCVLTYLDNI